MIVVFCPADKQSSRFNITTGHDLIADAWTPWLHTLIHSSRTPNGLFVSRSCLARPNRILRDLAVLGNHEMCHPVCWPPNYFKKCAALFARPTNYSTKSAAWFARPANYCTKCAARFARPAIKLLYEMRRPVCPPRKLLYEMCRPVCPPRKLLYEMRRPVCPPRKLLYEMRRPVCLPHKQLYARLAPPPQSGFSG